MQDETPSHLASAQPINALSTHMSLREMEQTEFKTCSPNNFSHVTETCQLTGSCLGLIFAVIFFRPLVGKHPGTRRLGLKISLKLNAELMLHRFKK